MQVKTETTVTLDSKEETGDSKQEMKESIKKPASAKKDNSNRKRLISMLVLTFGYFLVEIIVGYMTNSVALVADSFHMLSDVISLIIAYIAVRMSPKKWSQNTFGWARAEVLGALVNAVFLVALCFTIVTQSIQRFIEIEDVKEPKLILIVGTVGLVVNLIGLGLFHEHGHSHGGGGHGHGHSHSSGSPHGHSHSHSHNNVTTQDSHQNKFKSESGDKINQVNLVNWTVLPSSDFTNVTNGTSDDPHSENSSTTNNIKGSSSASQMNMHGVFLHVLADALGSVIVIISALVIWLTEWKYRMYIDPFLSLLMVCLICCSVWPLFVESSMVLLQTVPTHIQIDELKKKLLSQVQGAEEVHEFHIWQLSGNRIIASAHILCSNQTEYMRIGEEVKEFFHNEGIHSTTIQLEFANQAHIGENSDSDIQEDSVSDTRSDCFLTCPFDDEDADCVSNSCCGILRKRTTVVPAPENVTENSTIPNSINNDKICSTNIAFDSSDEENYEHSNKDMKPSSSSKKL